MQRLHFYTGQNKDIGQKKDVTWVTPKNIICLMSLLKHQGNLR